MATVTDQMTAIYVFVADYLQKNKELANWRQSPNAEPAFSDAEVITIGLMQSCLGVDKLKKAYIHMLDNYGTAFPKICSYKQWIARLHKLSNIVGNLMIALRQNDEIKLYLIDSKPIPVSTQIRHGRVRLLREEGAYFGKSSKGWFFGFKLHVLRNIDGSIVDAILTPGNWNDRDPVLALTIAIDGGVLLGDLGYRGPETSDLLAEEADLLLITRADAPEKRELISSVRQQIETLFSQLWHMFIDRVFSRSWLGLWNTIKLKLLSYNLRLAGLVSF